MAYVKVSTTKNVTAALRYGLHEKGAPAHGVNCPDDTETARKLFRADRIMWAKDDAGKLQGHVVIQSFDERDDLTPEQANELGQELARRVAPGHRAMIYTHKRGPHNHIVIESVNPETGQKLDTSGMLNKCRAISDEICREHGLHIIDGKHPQAIKASQAERGMIAKGKAGESWKIAMRSAIYDAMQKKSLDEFKKYLARRGITINERTRKRDGAVTWTYYDKAGHRCRAAKLGDLFTRERVMDAVEVRDVAAEVQAAPAPETAKTAEKDEKVAEPKKKEPLRAVTRPSEGAAGIPVPPENPPFPSENDISDERVGVMGDEYPPPISDADAPPEPEQVAEDFSEYEALRVFDYSTMPETAYADLDRIMYGDLHDIDHAAVYDMRLGVDRVGDVHVLPAEFSDKKPGESITFGELAEVQRVARAEAAAADGAEGVALGEHADTIDDLCDKADAALGKIQGIMGDVQKGLEIFDPKVKGSKKLKQGLKDLASGLIKTPIKMIRNILTNPIKGILLAPFMMFESAKDIAFGAAGVEAGAMQIATGDREARQAEEQKQRVRRKHTDSDGDEEDPEQEAGQDHGR